MGTEKTKKDEASFMLWAAIEKYVELKAEEYEMPKEEVYGNLVGDVAFGITEGVLREEDNFDLFTETLASNLKQWFHYYPNVLEQIVTKKP